MQRKYTVEIEEEIPVTVTANVTITTDPNYGADADGNRGMPVDFEDVDDIRVTKHGVTYDIPVSEDVIERLIDKAHEMDVEAADDAEQLDAEMREAARDDER